VEDIGERLGFNTLGCAYNSIYYTFTKVDMRDCCVARRDYKALTSMKIRGGGCVCVVFSFKGKYSVCGVG